MQRLSIGSSQRLETHVEVWKSRRSLLPCMISTENDPWFYNPLFSTSLFAISIGFLDGSVAKESASNAGFTGDVGLIPGSGRPPGEWNGNPFQYCCLETPTDREAWQATAQRVSKSRTRLSMQAPLCSLFLRHSILVNLSAGWRESEKKGGEKKELIKIS